MYTIAALFNSDGWRMGVNGDLHRTSTYADARRKAVRALVRMTRSELTAHDSKTVEAIPHGVRIVWEWSYAYAPGKVFMRIKEYRIGNGVASVTVMNKVRNA